MHGRDSGEQKAPSQGVRAVTREARTAGTEGKNRTFWRNDSPTAPGNGLEATMRSSRGRDPVLGTEQERFPAGLRRADRMAGRPCGLSAHTARPGHRPANQAGPQASDMDGLGQRGPPPADSDRSPGSTLASRTHSRCGPTATGARVALGRQGDTPKSSGEQPAWTAQHGRATGQGSRGLLCANARRARREDRRSSGCLCGVSSGGGS